MSETTGAPVPRKWRRLAGGLAVLAAGLIAVYLIAEDLRKPEPPSELQSQSKSGGLKDLARGPLTAFVIHPQRQNAPDLIFLDASGKETALSRWRGRVVLVNLWATWCAPCRREMPALAELQRKLGSKDFEVIAISLDRKGVEASGKFLQETGAQALSLYVDPISQSLDRLQALGLPASVLIDRQGREVGRIVGPADWASSEAAALIKAVIREPVGSSL